MRPAATGGSGSCSEGEPDGRRRRGLHGRPLQRRRQVVRGRSRRLESASPSGGRAGATSRPACRGVWCQWPRRPLSGRLPQRGVTNPRPEDSMTRPLALLLAAACTTFAGVPATRAGLPDAAGEDHRALRRRRPGRRLRAASSAQRLQEALGQPFVVENRPGAGSVIGTDARRQGRRPTATRCC